MEYSHVPLEFAFGVIAIPTTLDRSRSGPLTVLFAGVLAQPEAEIAARRHLRGAWVAAQLNGHIGHPLVFSLLFGFVLPKISIKDRISVASVVVQRRTRGLQISGATMPAVRNGLLPLPA
jgi:hypothetical protein